jgi:hypothetical protein
MSLLSPPTVYHHLTTKDTIVILEPPPGEGSPFKVQSRGEETLDDEEGYIADKSPLFAHECVGMYEPQEEAVEDEEDEGGLHATETQDFDPNKVDLNDPTLERFPSARDDIMDAVRKLESGLPTDHASVDGKYCSPVINPSRRGTEDITGDFSLGPPPAPSPPTQRAPKKSPRGSIGSANATASLHSISESEEPSEEPAAEEESPFRPAVVFSNPLKAKPKHLNLPTSDEDEGVALRDGVSPRTVKPARPSFMTSETSPTHPPSSPGTGRKGSHPHDEASNPTSPEAELDKHKERSLEEVRLRPSQSGMSDHANPAHAQTGPRSPEQTEKSGKDNSSTGSLSGKGAGENKATASRSSSSSKPGDTKNAATQVSHGRRPSYAEVVASPSPLSDDTPESKAESPQPRGTEEQPASKPISPQPVNPSDSKTAGPETPGARRPSYAEVAASKPGPADDKDKAKATTTPAAESSTPTSATTTARDTDTGMDEPESADLRRRGGVRDEQPAAAGDGANPPRVQLRQGGGWIRAVFRLVFVDFIGGIVKRMLRMFRMGWVLAMLGVRRERQR